MTSVTCCRMQIYSNLFAAACARCVVKAVETTWQTTATRCTAGVHISVLLLVVPAALCLQAAGARRAAVLGARTYTAWLRAGC